MFRGPTLSIQREPSMPDTGRVTRFACSFWLSRMLVELLPCSRRLPKLLVLCSPTLITSNRKWEQTHSEKCHVTENSFYWHKPIKGSKCLLKSFPSYQNLKPKLDKIWHILKMMQRLIISFSLYPYSKVPVLCSISSVLNNKLRKEISPKPKTKKTTTLT